MSRIALRRTLTALACVFLVGMLVACGGGGGANGKGGGLPFVKPTVPVVISYRSSAWGKGKVAIFSNQTASRLTVTVNLTSASGKEPVSGVLDLDPNGKREIGWMEGWKFESGDRVEVTHPDYSSTSGTIP